MGYTTVEALGAWFFRVELAVELEAFSRRWGLKEGRNMVDCISATNRLGGLPMKQPADPTTSSQNLFDNLTSWLFDPIASFSFWLNTQSLEDSTKEVKEFMWGKWLRFLVLHSIPIEYVLAQHLDLFFKEEEIEKAQRQRYVRLIERVYGHLIFLGLPLKNPGTEAGVKRMGKGANDPTVFLEEEEKEEVEKVIRCRFRELMREEDGEEARLSEEKVEKKSKGRKKKDWVQIRDAAICAVMVGGGATVWAIRRMTVSCTNAPDGFISLPRKGGADALAPLTPLAQATLEQWSSLRNQITDCGFILFPSDIHSRYNPTTLTTSPSMSSSAIFRAVRSLLADANISGARACGQTLRNTYAATLIDLGFDDRQITDALGLFDIVSAVRLRASWTSFQNKTLPLQ